MAFGWLFARERRTIQFGCDIKIRVSNPVGRANLNLFLVEKQVFYLCTQNRWISPENTLFTQKRTLKCTLLPTQTAVYPMSGLCLPEAETYAHI
ncbi:MAG TPA: hypothetical protein DCL44_08375 [Elusimicrobia bacterium]|nr:hypothetical protein [Elusimicrobiota bacterium]